MRYGGRLIFALLAASCSRDATIEGTLLDEDAASRVWWGGETAGAAVDSAVFRLEGVRGDTVDVYFGGADQVAGRMRILDLPRGARVMLHRVWFEDGIAFPTAVELASGRSVSINGLRMGTPGAIHGEIETRATVLAVDRDGDMLLVRPLDAAMPDIPVLVDVGATVRTVDGDPASPAGLSFGDSVALGGIAEGGFLLATDLTLPRSAAVTARASPSDRSLPSGAEVGAAVDWVIEGIRRALPPGRGEPAETRGREERGDDDDNRPRRRGRRSPD